MYHLGKVAWGKPHRGFESPSLRMYRKIMNFYVRYILPKYLNRAMRGGGFKKHRSSVVGHASGIVLEIGFGSGLNIPYYKEVTKLYALEPSDGLFALSQEETKSYPFPIEHLRVSAEEIPLADDSVDSVVSTWTLCSIPHPEIALREIFRVLRPGGKFLFIEHGKSPRRIVFWLQRILTPISKHITWGCHMDRDMERLIIAAGFKIQEIEKFDHNFKPLGFTYKGIASV